LISIFIWKFNELPDRDLALIIDYADAVYTKPVQVAT